MVRDFSDTLRRLTGGARDEDQKLLPRTNRLKAAMRSALDDAVFHEFALSVDRSRPRKRLLLTSASHVSLPYITWSAGQRESVPLLLGLFWLLPAARLSKREEIETVVIEEPEMGLHPAATSATMLLVLELLWRGLRVCLSTGSSDVLDVVWAIRVLKANGASSRDVLLLFPAGQSQPLEAVGQIALESSMRD